MHVIIVNFHICIHALAKKATAIPITISLFLIVTGGWSVSQAHAHTYRQFRDTNQPDEYVFGQWEKGEKAGDDTSMYAQGWHANSAQPGSCSAGELSQKPSCWKCCKATLPTTAPPCSQENIHIHFYFYFHFTKTHSQDPCSSFQLYLTFNQLSALSLFYLQTTQECSPRAQEREAVKLPESKKEKKTDGLTKHFWISFSEILDLIC